MTLQELFSDSSKWTQGAYARNSEGDQVPARDEEAVCWCLIGGLIKCYGDSLGSGYTLAKSKLMEVIEGDAYDRVIQFNDNMTTFEDIRHVVTEANV